MQDYYALNCHAKIPNRITTQMGVSHRKKELLQKYRAYKAQANATTEQLYEKRHKYLQIEQNTTGAKHNWKYNTLRQVVENERQKG